MPRPGEEDDREVEYDRSTRGAPSSLLLLGLLVVMLLGIAVVGGGWFLFAARQQAREAVAVHEEMVARDQAARADAVVPIQPTATMSREDFRSLLFGKTADEVMNAVGKPDSIQDGVNPTWFYNSRTLDPESRKADAKTEVTFKSGVVVSVNFR